MDTVSQTTPPSCQLRDIARRRPTYSMENGDQETLVHALSVGLRRSRNAANASPNIAISSSPFSMFSSERYHDMRDSRRLTDQDHRTKMANILDAALSISDDVIVESMLRQSHTLNSQISLGSISLTESDETESRQ